MIESLRKKFILTAMFSTLLVLSAIMGTINVMNYLHMIDRADAMTEMLLDNDGQFPRMQKGIPPEERDGNRALVQKPGRMDHMSAETPFETRFFYIITDSSGTVVSSNLDNIAAVDAQAAADYAEQAAEQKKETGQIGIYRYRVTETSEGTCYIFLDCQKEQESFRNFLLTSAGVSALGLCAVLILVMFFSRQVFRPVEKSVLRQKQFLTDASHELKTPLTIIDANTEVIEMENGESQWTKSTRNQIQRLSVLTQQLVTLCRLDEEQEKEQKQEFSLSDAITESIRPFQAPAKTAGKNLSASIEEYIFFRGNEKAIRQMMGIFMDNAVKYSPENGEIKVRLERKGRKILIEVFNDAGELPEGNLDILFERFYRLDTSRNSETGGSGIGLSVAEAIVRAHKGKIHAFSKDGKSLTVTVSF